MHMVSQICGARLSSALNGLLQEALEEALGRVAAGEAPHLLRRIWEQHQGTLCRGVSWDRHGLAELQLVAECIGGAQLAAVCRQLAQDHSGWSGGSCWVWDAWCWLTRCSSCCRQMTLPPCTTYPAACLIDAFPSTPGWLAGGMPDLLLWHPGRREAKLAEVKGPRDRLSDQQRAWMNSLADAGLRAEVLKVAEPGQAGGKKRRR